MTDELEYQAIRAPSCILELKSLKKKKEWDHLHFSKTAGLSELPTSPTHISLKSVRHYFCLATKSALSYFPMPLFFAKIIFPRQGHPGEIEVSRNWREVGGIPQKRPWQCFLKWIPHLDRNQQLTHTRRLGENVYWIVQQYQKNRT